MDDNDDFRLADLELERVVLGQMIGHACYPLYEAAGLTDDAFYRTEHRSIFRAVRAVHQDGAVADPITVRREDHTINAAYMVSLTDGVPKARQSNADYMSMRLLRLVDARACYYAAIKLYETLDSTPEKIDQAVADHLSTLEEASRRYSRQADRYDVDMQIRAYRDSLTRDDGRIFLGVGGLDEAVGGIRRGEVCGIMARPGVGKTLFLGHLIGLATNQEVNTIMFSLEMPVDQIVSRLARSTYQIGRNELESATRVQSLNEQVYHDTYKPLVIVDTPALSIADIEMRVRAEEDPHLVLIDHLGLVGGHRGLSTYDRVSAIARETKELAKRTRCAVVLAIQVSREAGGDGSRELTLGAARDSGIVEEVMDYLVALRRPDRRAGLTDKARFDCKDILLLSLLKNRHGDVGHESAVEMDPVSLELSARNDFSVNESLQNIGHTRRGTR
jgi:replicative DNA helicase